MTTISRLRPRTEDGSETLEREVTATTERLYIESRPIAEQSELCKSLDGTPGITQTISIIFEDLIRGLCIRCNLSDGLLISHDKELI